SLLAGEPTRAPGSNWPLRLLRTALHALIETRRLAFEPGQQRLFVAQNDAQRPLKINPQEAQQVTPGQANIQRRKVQPGQVLVAPATRHLATNLRPVQIDQRQPETL